MVFSSLFYLYAFMPITILLYNFSKSIKYKNIILFVASMFFYAWGEPIWIIQMLLTGLLVYISGLFIHKYENQKTKAKTALILGIIFALIPLIVFKYSGFFIKNINDVFSTRFLIPKWSMPIGISFYTFQTISYIVDLYRGECGVQKSLFKFWLYEALFPQLIAGPIVRYVDVEKEIESRKTLSSDLSEGMRRFIVGLAKKTIIANYAGSIVTQTLVGDALSRGSSLQLIIGIFAFTIQIYFDFSAYSDMAIGLGRIFGFHFKENFNYPYISASITEFWRRWHISLSSFFRDYVYIPLGGKYNRIRNLIVVWLLTGFWHGANWNFILWGVYNLIFILIESYILRDFIKKIPKLIRWIFIFFITMIGWSIFYFEDLNSLFLFFRKIFMMDGSQFIGFEAKSILSQNIIFFTFALISSFPIVPFIKNRIFNEDENGMVNTNLKLILNVFIILVLLILSTASLVGASYNPFLYFRF